MSDSLGDYDCKYRIAKSKEATRIYSKVWNHNLASVVIRKRVYLSWSSRIKGDVDASKVIEASRS